MHYFENWQLINHKYLQQVKTPTIYIGCMTGTSADKFADFTLVVFDDSGMPAAFSNYSHEVPEKLSNKLSKLSRLSSDSINCAERSQVEAEFSSYLSSAFNEIIHELKLANYPKEHIVLSPHGQTIDHSPTATLPYSDILVNGDTIVKCTGYTTISRHRQMPLVVSMAAPLAPVLLNKLFRNNEVDRVILNGGGIANICVLFKDQQKLIHGYDTGPANGPVDAMVHYILANSHKEIPSNLTVDMHRHKYDVDGRLAASGNILPDLLKQLLSHEYFNRDIQSKSADRASFDLDWVLPAINDKGYSSIDVLCTISEVVAISIADAIVYSLSAGGGDIKAEIISYGGLTKNQYIMSRIYHHLDKQGNFNTGSMGKYSPDHFESLLMGYLGYCAHNRISIDLSYCAREIFKANGQALAVPGSIACP